MVCDALFKLHDHHRLIHCGLKPDDILFVDTSDASDVKIIGFGHLLLLLLYQQLPIMHTIIAWLC